MTLLRLATVTALLAAPSFATAAGEGAPALQFRTLVTTAGDGEPIGAVHQLVPDGSGGVVALLTPAGGTATHLVHHPGPAGATATQATTLLTTGSEISTFYQAAVSDSPAYGKLVTFSADVPRPLAGMARDVGTVAQYRLQTRQLDLLHEPTVHGTYLPPEFDVNGRGQVVFASQSLDGYETVRTTPTAGGVTRDVEADYAESLAGFGRYLAPDGRAFLVHHPDGQPREIRVTNMSGTATVVGPGLSVGSVPVEPWTIKGVNDHQLLFDARAVDASPAGRDGVYLRTDRGGSASYEPLYSGVTLGEEFRSAGVLTPGGRAAVSVFAPKQTLVRYWDGSHLHGWAFTAGPAIEWTQPMISDAGDWVVLYATLPSEDDARPPLNAVYAWNPVLGIDPYVVAQTGGPILLDGTFASIADLRLMGAGGLRMDALSDSGELAIAVRLAGLDGYHILTASLPVPEPLGVMMLIPFIWFTGSRRSRRR